MRGRKRDNDEERGGRVKREMAVYRNKTQSLPANAAPVRSASLSIHCWRDCGTGTTGVRFSVGSFLASLTACPPISHAQTDPLPNLTATDSQRTVTGSSLGCCARKRDVATFHDSPSRYHNRVSVQPPNVDVSARRAARSGCRVWRPFSLRQITIITAGRSTSPPKVPRTAWSTRSAVARAKEVRVPASRRCAACHNDAQRDYN